MDTRILLSVVITIIAYHIISFQVVSADPTHRHHAKLCMGANTRPSRSRSEAVEECAEEFSSRRCDRLCRLEKLGVIRNGEVNEFMWSSFVEASFPTIAHPQLIPLFQACTPMYTKGTNTSSSKDKNCSENVKFSDCMRDAVQRVCSQPLPL